MQTNPSSFRDMVNDPAFDVTAIAESAMPSARKLWYLWACLSLAIFAGIYVIQTRMVAQEVQHIKHQLGLASRSVAERTASMVKNHVRTVEQVASNVSVQMYLLQLNASQAPEDLMLMPEREYLENLLIATAIKGGFKPAIVDESAVRASIKQDPESALAVVDASGRMVASTRGFLPLEGDLQDFISTASATAPSASPPLLIAENVIGFFVQAPIFAVQTDAAKENVIGRVVGVRIVDAPMAAEILSAPSGMASSLLVSASNLQMRMRQSDVSLTPLGEYENTAIADALNAPENTVSGLLINGASGFAVAFPVAKAGSVALLQFPDAHAFVTLNAQLRWIWLVTLLSLGGITAFLWALLRHSASLKAAASAKHYQDLAQTLDQKSRLLSLVTDTTPNAITIIDDGWRICFTNWPLLNHSTIMAADMQGKPIATMVGADAAERLVQRAGEALASQHITRAVEQRTIGDEQKHYQCLYIPLASIPVDLPFLRKDSQGVLVIEEDITALAQAREQQEQTLRRIVDCLVDFVDCRNPYAAQHSLQVAALARMVAKIMALGVIMEDTCEMAGKLLNIGKMHVPEDLLIQSGTLDAASLQLIREATSSSAAVVEGIAFAGPVAETIRQSLERFDGSGPLGMQGQDILLSARIVATANAFVGMISARAYRAPLTKEAATQQLMQGAGKIFDAQVVAALVHCLRE